jgi:hypothetical protein
MIWFTYQYIVEINPKVKQPSFKDTLVTAGGGQAFLRLINLTYNFLAFCAAVGNAYSMSKSTLTKELDFVVSDCKSAFLSG